MPSTTQRIGIIGGGLGGLAAACILAARHYLDNVTLNEWSARDPAKLVCCMCQVVAL